MRRIRARIDSLVRDSDGRPAVHLTCPANLRPTPGQCALAVVPGTQCAARTPLFPTGFDAAGFNANLPEAADWTPCSDLDLLTPVGTGFSPPLSSRRWLLAAVAVPPGRLLPLVDVALARGASVVFSATARTAWLPPAVEVVVQPWEAIGWADYLAVDLDPEGLPSLRHRLLGGAREPLPLALAAQALITPPMPCGLGTCAACSVATHAGWTLACQEGPVFSLHDLDW